MTGPSRGALPALTRPDAWNLVSLDYTRDLAPHCANYARDALALVPLPADTRILDVATGPGTLALLAAQRGQRVSALDFSPAMIALLHARSQQEGVRARIDACVGDGEALPFAAGAFAAAFSIFGLMFFANRARGLAELRRVVAAGGCAVISSWAPLEEVPAIATLFAALRRAAPELEIPPAPAPLGAVEDVRDALRAAGFAQVEVHTVSHELTFASTADFWSSFARSATPIALVRKRVGEGRWAVLAATAAAELSRALGSGPLRVPMPAHLGLGRR